MNKKLLFALTLCFILLISLSPVVSAAESIFSRAGNFIIDFASLKFLDGDADKLAAMVRICIWLLIFTIVFGATNMLRAGGSGLLTRGMSYVVAAIFATLGSFFIPPGLLLGIGEAYSTLVAAAMIGIIVIAVYYVLYRGPIASMTDTRMRALLRIAFLSLLIGILEWTTNWITGKFN